MAGTWVQRLNGDRAERVRHEWSQVLPVTLRSAIHGDMSEGRFRQPWSRRLVLVKWVIRGEIVMGVGGRRLTVAPGDVAVYIPTQPHQFWCHHAGTEMCWFSVDGPLAEQFVHLLGLRAGVYRYGPPPVARVDELIKSLADQTLDGARRSSALAVQTLYDVASHIPSPQTSSIVQRVRHLINEGLADPDLSAQRLASQLGYNRGALSRMFHTQTGMTIMDCITQTRLSEAELLLTRSDERVGDVARKCGFRDLSYFTRWVRKHTGRLPSELRATRGIEDSASPASRAEAPSNI